tara:strand:+ start:149 stop:445 length:297 start_codon:yes stop_codon:yes gene_type:complete
LNSLFLLHQLPLCWEENFDLHKMLHHLHHQMKEESPYHYHQDYPVKDLLEVDYLHLCVQDLFFDRIHHPLILRDDLLRYLLEEMFQVHHFHHLHQRLM